MTSNEQEMVFVSPKAQWLSKQDQDKVSQAVVLLKEVYGEDIFANDNLISMGRHIGFFKDIDFQRAYTKECHTPHSRSLVWRLHVLGNACLNALELDGDLVECGVFKGFKSAFLCEMMQFQQYENKKAFYLYDTFDGIPEKYAHDSPIEPTTHQRPGLLNDVRNRFEPYPNVHVVQGVVPDCLAHRSPSKVAYLHLDMNSAIAEAGALAYFWCKLVPSAWIVLDDYGWKAFGKQKEAADKFFADKGYHVTELPTGQGLVVIRAD